MPGDPHGWMVAVDVDSFKETAAIPTSQQGFGGGIWQGAGGPAGDDQGNVYVMTGNGGFDIKKNAGDTTAGQLVDFNGTTDFAEAFIRFKYQKTGGKGSLVLDDWYIPFQDSKRSNQGNPDYQDQDLGSGAPILPPGTNLLMGAGKDGISLCAGPYQPWEEDRRCRGVEAAASLRHLQRSGFVDQPSESGFQLGWGPDPGGGASQEVLTISTRRLAFGPDRPAHSFLTGAKMSRCAHGRRVPVSGQVRFLGKSAEIASHATALDQSIGGMTGGMISTSSNGTANGIVWTLAPVDGNANQAVVTGIARAYDAANLNPTPNTDGTPRLKLLWDSTQAGVMFDFSKFCPPMVADGKLYVATYDGRVDVYALKP